MNSPVLSISRRTRQTPFTNRVTENGVKAYSVYNHMLLPTVFDSVEADYRHLKDHVQLWDVACERQVEVRGPDAARLLQMLTPRDLGTLQVGQCYYTPMVDETGGMLNDPLTLKLAADRYWISVADSDLLYWIKGLAYGLRLEVDVDEPDVSPLAIQGPKADDLAARVFGEAVRDIRFFRFARLPFEGHELIVARSGYSKQGGFEIYVDDSDLGEPLWDALFAAGADLGVRAGGPNLIERIEAGLLSYGNDMTRENTPHECGLGKFCQTQSAIGCVGRDALLRVAVEGPIRQIRSLSIAGEAVPPCTGPWTVFAGREKVGRVTSAAWSPDFETNVAIGMIRMTHWNPGTEVEVDTPDGMRPATIRDSSFI
ncbi:dimethylsulfoniopropionate demethylase [Sneathiella sp. CAU 1612]|uniref:Dimethylsulfoniopropionate demethylase n=1 Tax=Sneathiella sedimenti TaxID=2816034 RepID=A0ABS3F5S5_9PROT|nr:dimethylsulfoniopropionate demethylase [Sneathiella sedimenti]MBO0333491.1 dimethylsulfoniopropionate demethylase [Sneathiella sedimenti]